MPVLAAGPPGAQHGHTRTWFCHFIRCRVRQPAGRVRGRFWGTHIVGAMVPPPPLDQGHLGHGQGGHQDHDHLGVHGLVPPMLRAEALVLHPGITNRSGVGGGPRARVACTDLTSNFRGGSFSTDRPETRSTGGTCSWCRTSALWLPRASVEPDLEPPPSVSSRVDICS